MEDVIANIIVAVVFLTPVLLLIYLFFKGVFYIIADALGLAPFFVSKKTMVHVTEHLKDHTYYNKLSEEGRKVFTKRVCLFMEYKKFEGASGFLVTEQTKALISASAVQLTFGLDSNKLDGLSSIIIFPSKFHLPNLQPEFKGATYKSAMFLSWDDFKSGNDNATDQVNLGIHEMTHALKLNAIFGNDYDEMFKHKIHHWERYIIDNFEDIKKISISFLRKYHTTNHNEFFAVAVEAFFENPHEFKTHLPEIFDKLVVLLNQDPRNVKGDYKIPAQINANNFERMMEGFNVK